MLALYVPVYTLAPCSMSLGWKNGFQSLDDAVRAAIRQGIHVSVSAGNDWVDACTQSPARVAEA